jgi:hypothetical protein
MSGRNCLIQTLPSHLLQSFIQIDYDIQFLIKKRLQLKSLQQMSELMTLHLHTNNNRATRCHDFSVKYQHMIRRYNNASSISFDVKPLVLYHGYDFDILIQKTIHTKKSFVDDMKFNQESALRTVNQVNEIGETDESMKKIIIRLDMNENYLDLMMDDDFRDARDDYLKRSYNITTIRGDFHLMTSADIIKLVNRILREGSEH